MDHDKTMRPTKKQRLLLEYIQSFIDQHGYSPSYREIVNGCGYSSVATVAVHINNLIARGHLRKRDHSARSLELTTTAGAPTASAEVADIGGHEAWVMNRLAQLIDSVETVVDDGPLPEGLLHDIESIVAALPALGIAVPPAIDARLRNCGIGSNHKGV